MGYSVSVRFTSPQERDLMQEFIMENQDILDQLVIAGNIIPSYYKNIPSCGEDLPYAPNFKSLLGFHGTITPNYIWDLCAWMAVKSSYRAKNSKIFFYYDNEKMYVSTDIKNSNDILVDENGVPAYKELSKEQRITSLEIYEGDKEKIKDLLIELNNRWESINNEKKQTNKLK